MKTKYSDSEALHIIEKGYNEATRSLLFWSVPIETDKLQEALDIIGEYNEFNSKKVGRCLIEMYPDCRFIVGREFSVVVYVITKEPRNFWLQDMQKIQAEAVIDEVSVNQIGMLRLWWD